MIYQDEAAQMGHHVTWFEEEYPDQPHSPVLIHPATILHRRAYLPGGTKVMGERDLRELNEAVRQFVVALSLKQIDQWRLSDIEEQLRANLLKPTDLIERRLGHLRSR